MFLVEAVAPKIHTLNMFQALRNIFALIKIMCLIESALSLLFLNKTAANMFSKVEYLYFHHNQWPKSVQTDANNALS